ncbi:MAG: hypothetical protein KDA58_14625, partial [Planctomycetaceae bacterium]|nr:hypothetical protein [Planctomycetaceae bacterium]
RSAVGEEAKRAIVDQLRNADPEAAGQIQAQLADVIERSSPEQLARFGEEIRQTGGANLTQRLGQWWQAQMTPANSVPTSPYPGTPTPSGGQVPSQPQQPTQPQITQAQATQMRQELTTLIASKVSDFPIIRNGIVSQINAQLDGVPDQVAVEVLRDWFADITGQADPDPGTTRQSRTEDRILRQLSRFGYSFEQLSRPLQDRLRSAQGGERALY